MHRQDSASSSPAEEPPQDNHAPKGARLKNQSPRRPQVSQSITTAAAAEALSGFQTSYYGAVAALNKALGNIQTPQSIAATAAAETLSRYQTSHYGAVAALNKALGNIQTPQSIAATAAAETLSRYQTSHYGAVAALNKALGNIQTPQSIAATAAAETLSRYQTSHYETLFSATNIASKALQKRNAGILWSTGTLTREYFELAQSLSAFSDALRPISRYPALSPVSALTAARNLQKTLGSNSSFKMPAAQSATEALWSADAATLTEHVNDLLSHEDTRSKVGALSDIFDATLEKDSSAKSKRRKYRLSNADPGILIFSSLVMLLSLTGDAVGAVDPDIAPIVDHHATTLGIAVAMILYIHDQLRKD